jgi:hypothetical protein
MLIIPPPKREKKKQPTIKPPPMVVANPPVLVSAYYDDTLNQLTLGFSRAVDASGLNGSAIAVDDGEYNNLSYQGTGGVTVLDESTIRIGLVSTGRFGGTGETLNAAWDNGIVAVDDGTGWMGASGLALPFP